MSVVSQGVWMRRFVETFGMKSKRCLPVSESSHSVCHCCMISWYSWFLMKVIGRGILVVGKWSFFAAAFASVSANSLPSVPWWARTQEMWYFLFSCLD